MRNIMLPFLLGGIFSLVLVLNGCNINASPSATPDKPSQTSLQPAPTVGIPTLLPTAMSPTRTAIQPSPTVGIPTLLPTAIPPTPTVKVEGQTIVVTSTADIGPGTLRQALLEAKSGDTINFDPLVFPPNAPVIIYLESGLPEIVQGNLTIDASNAGVILDGSRIQSDEWCPALRVFSSGNILQGLQMMNFSNGAGIEIAGGAQHNLIKGNVIGSGGVGIVLGGKQTAFNKITENFIGVNQDGAKMQLEVGIWIEDGAHQNTIGPGNTIAFANSTAITIIDASTTENTLTQNSIYGNLHGGISLAGDGKREGGNLGLPAPTIIDFDLQGGEVAGSTCPRCLVEIFSDEGNQGRNFEGSITADSAGNFRLNVGTPFAGPHLTATATDSIGNTSAFSDPTIGQRSLVILQEGNSLPRLPFQPKRSAELADNRIGEANPIYSIHCEIENYAGNLARRADELSLKWMRVFFEWMDWAELEAYGGYSDFQLDECQTEAVEKLHQNGIQVYYNLTFWDPVFSYSRGYSRFRDESEIKRFLDYTRLVVENIRGNVSWYSILNEPNQPGEDQRYVKVNDYIELVRRVVPLIRELDPHAKIIIGEVTPLNELDSYNYLMQILQTDDVMAMVDGIAWHGSSGLSLEYQPDYYHDYHQVWVDQIVQTAREHGFNGEFFSTELHWRTPDTPQTLHGKPWFYSDLVAAKYYARGIVWHLWKGFYVGIGHERYEQIFPIKRVLRNLATLFAGARPTELDVVVEGIKADVQVTSFILPDGSYLVALWRDEKAVDDDPGVQATVTFKGVSKQKVIGFDVLNGFEQQLIGNAEGEDLSLHGVLVKDYPIILHLTNHTLP